ncbi:ABC transporter ATP-binding protein [Mucilaginibacter lappiensis]|uniref:ABC-2 type transport system ATP-binding protein n=1 Tax=Mucilaginibacter lappiensis TaxID=354630 RepID=A0A1N6Q4X8_9SPHI|nr:ABC transporter ATP-binding protein [Mucilaginibacter lappiensis]MBB6107346.1 ABC-2 type transport system ATP-binding protein [Mucilaginibacter lappiensis]MBB6126334.1 ABC-2 type transport system ATP-binding protein [Mucilaginibacter lappiensis]SIQ11519.1 ABC-2 type transport system ATP-binding protein [Mucilaginibacter lappiensis]
MIQIKDLQFGYQKNKPLFKGLHLNLTKGHIYGLLGKNGAGKSTLLKNMAGLAYPQHGKCYFKGINVSGRPVAVLEDIYFLAEELFVPNLTPAQFVANTAYFYPRFNKADFYRYLSILDVDIDAIMDKQSFGQQKKAMIAFGLAANTGLLIMDEPTNGLDIPSKVQFRKLIASVLTEDRCIVISTHQVRDLDSLIDTLLILHNGEIIINQSIDEVQEKILFESYHDTQGLPVLYEETGPRGKNVILKNESGEYSKVDLELLFNAIIIGNQSVLQTLKASAHE